MTGNLQADGVQSRQTLFVRYCPNFIYAFTQGQEKLQLDSNAQLKYRNSWACTALFSSETYLVNAERDNLGIIARVITLDGLTYTVDGVHSEQIKAFTGKNYGYIGSLLAEHLLASDSAEILQQFQDVREELLELFPETCSLSERLAMNYAMIVTTSAMLNTLGIQTNTEILKQMCVLLHGEITEEAHPGKNLVCRIFNYICSNYKRIDGVKWTLDRKKKLPMEDITRLKISRNRLRESFFYYDGYDTEKQKASEEGAANDRMIDLAADVLVAILMEERAS